MIRYKKAIPLISFFFLLLIVLSLSFLSSPRIVVFDFLSLPLKFFVYPGKIISEIVSFDKIDRESSYLKSQNSLLMLRVARLEEIKNENIRLRELLGLKQVSQFRLVAAKVIARDPDNWMSTLIIDRGYDAGISQDCVVIGQKGLVGIISDAGLSTSRVILINDSNFNCAALLTRSRVQALLSGSIFAGCRLRFISREDDVAINDAVITSGLSLEESKSLFPKGIVIGKVKFIGEESAGLGKYALVEPVEQLGKLEEVLVIIP